MVLPINWEDKKEVYIRLERISEKEFCSLIKQAISEGKLENAIGHKATAVLINELCGTDLKPERKAVFMNVGDIGLHILLLERRPEGKILSLEELKRIPKLFIKSEVISTNQK